MAHGAQPDRMSHELRGCWQDKPSGNQQDAKQKKSRTDGMNNISTAS